MTLEPKPPVKVQEPVLGMHSIVSASTSTTAFVGYTDPLRTAVTDWNQAVEISSIMEYAPRFGDPGKSVPGDLPRAVNAYFANGGMTALIVALRVSGATFAAADFAAQLQPGCALDKTPFQVLVIPGVTDAQTVQAAVHCGERNQALVVLDPPRDATVSSDTVTIPAYAKTLPASANAALYCPWLNVTDAGTGATIAMPPSGFVAGVYARMDTTRGVWKAPAGQEAAVTDTSGPVVAITDAQQGVLNPAGINCLRNFKGSGTLVWGSRTLAGTNDGMQYVPVKRTLLFVEQSVRAGLGWAVFEPNKAALWVAVSGSVQSFLMSLFRQGALQGSKPSEAFFVKCDATTMTQTDIDNGHLVVEIGMAMVRPAEFVIFRIGMSVKPCPGGNC